MWQLLVDCVLTLELVRAYVWYLCVCVRLGRTCVAWSFARRGCAVAHRCRPHAVLRARQDGRTALHQMACNGQGAVVSALLSAGADPNVQMKVRDGAADLSSCRLVVVLFTLPGAAGLMTNCS